MAASMIVFWGILIWGALSVMRNSSSSNRGLEANDPEQILRARFAGGDIDVEEFERRRDVLRR